MRREFFCRARLAGWLLAFLLSACAPAAAQPALDETTTPPGQPVTSIPTPSPGLTLTPTFLPTQTPTATATMLPATLTPTPTSIPVTTLLFTGVIVPARCVQAAIDARSDPYFPYAEVREIIQAADLAIGTLNATISDYPPRTGCVRTYVLVGGAENADALADAGFDAMSVATNHIKNCGLSNCGLRAFFDTLGNLERVGISAVGAGENLRTAEQPLILTVNGVRFGIVSLGQIEQMAFAGEDTPGIAILTEESLRAAIAAARQAADVVIAMPHWGPEDVPVPNWSQRSLAQVAVEAGADLVVGNHTHVVQAVQEIQGIPVFYGLGNFVFDQFWALDHMQGVILQVRFAGRELLDYELIPTHVDGDGTVHLAGPEEAAQIMDRIESASRGLR